MKKFIDFGNVVNKENKIGYLAAGIIFTSIRISGDILLIVMNKLNSVNLNAWNFISTLAILVAFLLFAFSMRKRNKEINNYELSVDFLKDTNTFLLLSLGIFFGSILVNVVSTIEFIPANIFALLIQLSFSLFVLITSVMLLRFMHKWFNIRKHKRTKLYLYLVGYIYVYFILRDMIKYLTKLDLSDIIFIDVIGYFSIVILAWLLTSKTNWVAILPRELKIKQFWLSLFSIVISIIIIQGAASNNSNLNEVISKYLPASESVVTLTFTIFLVFILRIFLSTAVSLPTTKIVERRTSELSSLTYLNKFIADSVNNDSDNLLQIVTRLALQAVGAKFAWTEVYENDESFRIINATNLDKQSINFAHSYLGLKNIFLNFKEIELIESVPEAYYLSNITQFLADIKSMIIVPLYSGADRIGTLLVADTEEYSLERDDLNVLNAFSDNVRIALENNRLVKDSIEKEKYKNELMLAQKIQNKLLPQTLPIISNYSISASSIPATEVGGDYYDVVKLKNGNYCVLIGDVSGKGLSAAFYMAQLKGIVLSVSEEANSPRDLLIRINKILHGNMEKQMYITMSALSINDDQGSISFARAGHMPFFIKTGQFISTYIPKGIGLGLGSDLFFKETIEEVTINLSNGDSCILFTDGINELKCDNKEEFGYNPLKKALTSNLDFKADTITKYVLDEIKNYGDDISHSDDMTIFALTFNKNSLN